MTTTGLPTPTYHPTAATPERQTAENTHLRDVLATLERGIAAILTSEAFARYLRAMGRFPAYSPNNVALIHAQRPDATRVAGYRAWQVLGRQVRKGERSIRIIAPFRTRVEAEEGDADKTIVTGYTVRTVFDLAQTVGEPLPLPPIHGVLAGDATTVEIVRTELTAWLHAQGVKVTYTDTGRANGYYLPDSREIGVHRDLTGVRAVKTLVHEAAHFAADHCGGVAYADAETVAESAAYVVLAHFALDTGGYSFGYVANWAREMAVFHRNVAAIGAVARTLISAITGEEMGRGRAVADAA